MATFSLSKTSGEAINRIQAWTINDVVFKDVELKSGTTKDGKVWKAIQFKFSGDNGVFEPMFFCPGEGGDQRVSGETNGKKWELPSAMEQLALAIAHVTKTLNPEGYAKLQAVTLNLPDDFDKLVECVKKVLTKSKNKATRLKVIGNNKGYATVPNFINISKEGEAYISNNWLGENVTFSNYEMTKMKSAKNTKPTEIKEDPIDSTEDTTSGNDDLDFDI